LTADKIRDEILSLVAKYYQAAWPEEPFVPGETPVPVSGRVFDADELVHLVDASLDFWLTTGRYADQFEEEFARFMGVRHAILCNSGSSANLLAISALTSSELGEKRLKPGDEVITVAAGFPTTVNPIIQNRLVPVFVDIELGTYNIDVGSLEKAIGPRTRAIILAHTLGNPFNIEAVLRVAKDHALWLIEDNCDALGSRYKGQLTGTFGDLATASFYPAHHITMGEGGCVITNQTQLAKLVRSFRDWGRDCWCKPGKENTCGKRFQWQLGELPYGYDHKYIYSHIGYNLKLTDMQAAVGVAQLKKLPSFIEARKRNWRLLYEGLKSLEEFFILPRPTPGSDPSWFGFLLTVKEDAPFSRDDIVNYLEEKKIVTRMLFAGNIARQPVFTNNDIQYSTIGDLKNTDKIMMNTFWIGVWPGIGRKETEYIIREFGEFVEGKHGR